MAIYYEEKNKILGLDTKKSTYLIGLTRKGMWDIFIMGTDFSMMWIPVFYEWKKRLLRHQLIRGKNLHFWMRFPWNIPQGGLETTEKAA